jgi:hypothetical protein
LTGSAKLQALKHLYDCARKLLRAFVRTTEILRQEFDRCRPGSLVVVTSS